MAGAPSGAALAEARLVGSGCKDMKAAGRRLANERIKQMYSEVDDQLRAWVDGQPGCWQEYRARAAEEKRRAMRRCAAGVTCY